MRYLLLTLALLHSGCSSDAPSHLTLFDGLHLLGQLDPISKRLAEPGPGDWIRVHRRVPPVERKQAHWPGVAQTSIGLAGFGAPPGRNSPHELRVDGVELPLATIKSGFSDPDTLKDGVFYVANGQLYLLDRAGRFAQKTLNYYAWIERKPRPSIPGLTTNGLLLLPGESFTMDLPGVAGDTADLVFATSVIGALEPQTTCQLSVEVNGTTVFATDQVPALTAAFQPQRLRLPSTEDCQLTFRVKGGDGIALFSTPTIHSVAAERPAAKMRPDVIVFLADTFRADNLAAWGADPNLAPNINRFAKEGIIFSGARSPATWTLPSQASLLTSLYPFQHGAIRSDLRLPDGLETLAERMAAAGYRTAAVTDGVLVTARHGLARGFDVFLDAPVTKDFDSATLERLQKVLDLDDGRPLFLYLQSYRVHSPYTASSEAFATHPDLFGPDPDPSKWNFAEMFTELLALRHGAETKSDKLVEISTRLKSLYQGGVNDFDRGFAKLLQMLELNLDSEPLLVLTSDHGESFLEHREVFHGTSVHEEETLVPLIFWGPGIQPKRINRTVTLVDLAPTLTDLVGIDPGKGWVGRSLFGPTHEGPNTYSFMCMIDGLLNEETDFALFDDQRKIVGGIRDGQLSNSPLKAFNLDVDPFEHTDLAPKSPAWIQSLFSARQAELEQLLRPRGKNQSLRFTEEERANLAAMGYTDD